MDGARRAFLRRAGATAIGTAAAALALPSTQPDQPVERPTDAHGGPRPPVSEETETPYALWQYSREASAFERTSPINLVVTLAGSDRTFDEVLGTIEAAGWVRRPVEYIRFAYNAHRDRYEREHASAAQTFHGAFGRHHLRAWHFDGYVSIQAHEDTAAMPKHEVAAYETTKHLLEWCFDAAGWTVKPDGAHFDNASDPDHEGLVTVIEP